MKKLLKLLILITVVFLLMAAGINSICSGIIDKRLSGRNIAANRINSVISEEFLENGKDIEAIIASGMDGWKVEFGENAPRKISFIPVLQNGTNVFYNSADGSCAVCSIYGVDGKLVGFIRYDYSSDIFSSMINVVNAVMLICFLMTAGFAIYVHFTVLEPFRRLSEYPERLARLRDIRKLPESRNRSFGRYIWGMNMLADVLSSSRRHIYALEGQRETLISTIAHGVKTPVSNIRLYTDAVRTGLYSERGMSLEIAEKIDRNAEKIGLLAEELLASTTASVNDSDIEIDYFMMSELAEIIRSEYNDRMKLKRIPFSVECKGEAVIESDKYALYRAVSQILENALKYGDGSGISVKIMRDDESLCISVRNRGELLPEKEIPYIFRSYWRGSNAADKEGSGIGMYIVHETVKALGGGVHARRLEETSEMEFVIYIEKA